MQLVKDLPAIFDSFCDARRQGFLNAYNLKEQNIPLIGTYCTFMPQEIPLAIGAAVVSLCSTSDETINEAEKILPRNLCPLIKSSYGFGITDKCPYFYFSDLVIGETTCDGKKKMYEYMAEFKAVHIMQLPNTSTDNQAIEYWRNEIIKLKEIISARFNREIDENALKKAINLKNRERQALLDFYRLGELNPPALSGKELLSVLYGATFKFDKEALINELQVLTQDVKTRYTQGQKLEAKPRILITGCPIGGAAEKVVTAIENNGAWVVGFENCTGAKANEVLVDEDKEVYLALAEKYLAIGCSCISPNSNRLKLIGEMIETYQVDGVVDVILQACHTYAVESALIKRYVNEKYNIPYIAIETDYSQSDLGQLNTRAAAFIEML